MIDPIERQAAIDAVSKGCQEWRGIFSRCEENILAIPSAQSERELELDGTESNIEILSELRAMFNCFDEAEEPVYRALSDAICALSAQPERMIYANMSDEEFERWLYEHGICNPNIHESIPCEAVPLLIDNAISELPSSQPEYEEVTPRNISDHLKRAGVYEPVDWFSRLQFLNEMGYVICRKENK